MSELFSYCNEIYWLLLLAAVFTIIYQYIWRTWSYFSDRNVKFVRGVPLLGSVYRSLIGAESAAEVYRSYYEEFPEDKFIGLYDLLGKPAYLIRDPDLIKRIGVTEFDHFANHKFTFANGNDTLFSKTLFALTDDSWKTMRATMSTAFTGNAVKKMFSLISNYTEHFIKHLKIIEDDMTTLNSKQLFSRYINDIIATTAFGIELDSMKDRDNEFYKMTKALTNDGLIDDVRFVGKVNFPKLMALLKVKIVPEKYADFMREIVLANIRKRQQHSVVRNDLIDSLIKAREGQLKQEGSDKADDEIGFAVVEESDVGQASEKVSNWTDEDTVAQCMVFILGGFETVSRTVAFLLHELAVNPDIQTKLHREISAVHKQLDGESLQYDTLKRLKYLDMVVSETLRRWAINPIIERVCTKSFVMENSDTTKVILNVGDTVYFPVHGVHMDEQYFPNAENFDPERFSDENINSLRRDTFFPFGLGPRACIASRYAIAQVKTLIYYLLLDFIVDKSWRTQDPLVLKAVPLHIDAEKGFYIGLRRRH